MTVENNAPDVVMWVGTKFYPTIDHYVREAFSLGCAKRIPKLPEDIVPGKSRCFLAHDEGKVGEGRIFGFFVISGVEIILDDEAAIEQYQNQYQTINITQVTTAQVAVEPLRLCGHRHYGAKYLVSEDNTEQVWEAVEPLADKVDIKGSFVVLLNPIPYPRLRFRDWRYMEPEFLAGYDWPQRSLPVQRTVKIEAASVKPKEMPLLEGVGTL